MFLAVGAQGASELPAKTAGEIKLVIEPAGVGVSAERRYVQKNTLQYVCLFGMHSSWSLIGIRRRTIFSRRIAGFHLRRSLFTLAEEISGKSQTTQTNPNILGNRFFS
jgi:hypothetical protein